MSDGMSIEELTTDQILCVLENLHKNASDYHEEMGMSYDESLSLMFHSLWTTLEN